MGKRKAALGERAWRLLRVALLWARKGGAFKREALPDLRLVPSYIKSLWAPRSDMIHFAEREFSFDETPIFHFRTRRPRSMRVPHIPCINCPVDFDGDVDDDVLFGRDERMTFLHRNEVEEEEEEEDRREGEDIAAGGSDGLALEEDDRKEDDVGEEDRGIDAKAEEFIAKFYQQMKLQRQISLLQYNGMLLRSTS